MTPEKPKTSYRRYSPFPKALGRELEQLVKPVYKQQGFTEHRLLTEWDKVVGRALAAGSVPKKLTFPKGKREDGVLQVAVSSGAKALELQHMQPMILERICVFYGYKAIVKVVFVQDSSLQPPPKPRKTPVKKVSSDKVAALVAGCEDDALRQALASLGSEIIRSSEG